MRDECVSRKIRYALKWEAVRVFSHTKKAKGSTVYKCPQCRGYHLGRTNIQKMNKPRKEVETWDFQMWGKRDE